MIILTLACMVACGKDNQSATDATKFVPIFEGATLVETQTTQSVKRAQMLDDDDDFDYEGVIPDVIVDSDITYHATPGSEVRVKVNIKNPSQFEILSLTINETKYQSYQFEDGSNSDVLYIDVKVPNVSGEYTYLIDNIKYIDGDDIEDVNMSNGNKTIKFGVTYDELPTLNVTNKTITKNSYEATVQARDVDGVITKANGLKAYLFDVNHTLIKSTEIKGESFTFTDLKEGNKYTLVIATGLDLLDGKGGKNHILYKETFATLASAYISDVTVTDTTISYKINKDNENIIINSVKLVNTTTNKIIDVTNVLNIGDLLSNNSYKLVLNYTTNDVTYESYVIVMTSTNSIPTINGLSLTSTKDGFTFDYTVTDNDNVVRSEEIFVTKDGVTVYNGPAANKVVNNLLSNTTYNVTLKVGYDLRDGSGINYVENTNTISTLAKVLPTVGVEYTVTEGVFNGKLNVVDTDNVYKLTNIELLDMNGLFIREITDLSNVNGLSLNTKYQIKVNYTYDLNDGNGSIADTQVFNFITGKQKPTLELSVYDKTDVSFSADIKETDINNIGDIKSIRLYTLDNVFIKDVAISNKFKFDNLSSTTEYIVKVEYSYDLGDGNGNKEEVYETTVTTLKAKPTIESLELTTTKDSITFNYNVSDLDNVVLSKDVTLYKNNKLVSDIHDLNTFNNLLSNTLYEVRLVVTYDLSDGKGTQTITLTKEITTVAKVSPTVGVEYTVTEGVFNGKLNVVDTDNLYKLTNIELLDMNGLFIREITDLANVTGLALNTKYKIRVNYTYDLNNGNGSIADSKVIDFTTGKQKPTLELNVYDTTDVSFSGDIKETDINNIGEIKSIKLYTDKNVFIKELPIANKFTFDGLSNKTTYIVKVEYSYDLGDGNGNKEEVYETTVTTLKAKPTIESLELTTTKDSITFNYNVSDLDNVVLSKDVTLYKNNKLVSDIHDLNTFNNLLSNTLYEVRLVVAYDLIDGKGTQTITLTKEITTVAKVSPIIGIDYTVIENEFRGTLNIVDNDNVFVLDHFELYNNSGVLVQKLNDISVIPNLNRNTNYKLKVIYSYDLNDGNGKVEKTFELDFSTTKVVPTVELNAYSVTESTIGMDVIENDPNLVGEIKYIRIYTLNGEYIDQVLVSSTFMFYNLNPNTKYTVKVFYDYDLNDGNGTINKVFEKEVQTSKRCPSVSVSGTVTKNTIDLDLNINDVDNAGSVTNIKLLLNGVVVYEGLETKFSNLLTDTLYNVEITYTYDLCDNYGTRTLVINDETTTFKTLNNNFNINYSNLKSNTESISFNLDVLDESNSLKVNKIELFDNNVLFSSKENVLDYNVVFNSLKKSTLYKIVVSYSYDLNDGKGLISNTLEFEYRTTTGGSVEVVNVEVLNQGTLLAGSYLDARIFINNPNNLNITAIYIDGLRYDIRQLTGDSVVVNFLPQTDGGVYNMSVTGYSYMFNEFELTENVNVVSTQSINVLGDLGLSYFGSANDKHYVISGSNDICIRFDGTKEYEILGFETSEKKYTKGDFTVVNSGEIRFSTALLNSCITLRNITYGLGDQSVKVEINQTGDFYIVENGEVLMINDAKDFSNLLNNRVYELNCDINFSGVKHIPTEFSGVILGNNHTISNFSLSVDVANKMNAYGLFSIFSGYIENLNFESPYINVNVKADNPIVGVIAGRSKSSVFNNIKLNNVYVKSNGTTGGLLGELGAYTGQPFAIENVRISGEIIGDYKVGGLAGYVTDEGKVNIISNRANVTSSKYSGGIFGELVGGSPIITNVINYGTITSTRNDGAVGGIIGGTNTGGVTINNAINVGKVLKENGLGNGVIGHINVETTFKNTVTLGTFGPTRPSFENCYATETSDEIINIVTLEGLKNKEFWLKLKFDETIWNLDDLINNFPSLK